ncbi:MAG: hypothetical protein ABJL67_13230 [Sulfitobacter sp.]
MAPSWKGPTGPASRGVFFVQVSDKYRRLQKLSVGGAEGQAPCPADGPALSAQEHRMGGAVSQSHLSCDVLRPH